MISTGKIHPHDVGLPEPVIRKRRRSRRLAWIMLSIAIVTAICGWRLLGTSIFSAIHIKDQPPSLAIIAYAFLIVSSATLVLGLWYMLLAQVERLARMVDAAELEETRTCTKCHRILDAGDRFCRDCGQAVT